jgi:hypothetical protein
MQSQKPSLKKVMTDVLTTLVNNDPQHACVKKLDGESYLHIDGDTVGPSMESILEQGRAEHAFAALMTFTHDVVLPAESILGTGRCSRSNELLQRLGQGFVPDDHKDTWAETFTRNGAPAALPA